MDEQKIAYVLGGGGSKGAFQAGVLKQLQQNRIVPDKMYGTSVGALNAGVFSFNRDADLLIRHWVSIQGRSDILSFNYRMLFLMGDGLYSMRPLRRDFIDKYIRFNANAIHPIETEVCRVNLVTGETDYVNNSYVIGEDFRDAVQDSATIPAAMAPRDIYVDGGLREVVPLGKAIADGYKHIKIILTSPWQMNPWHEWDMKSKSKFLRFFYLTLRATDGVMNHEVLYNDLYSQLSRITDDMRVDVYAPPHYLYDTLEFNPVKIRRAIDLGLNAEPVNIKELFKD